MSKNKPNLKSLLKQWIANDPNFSTDGQVIFCQTCCKQINSSKKYFLDQHKGTELHKKRAVKENGGNKEDGKIAVFKEQPFLANAIATPEQQKFNLDLCDAMVAANIPWSKLENPVFKAFLSNYTKRNVPAESTLRKNYLPVCFDQKIRKIKESLGNSYFWLSVDETTDRCGRYIANVIVGALRMEPSEPYLIACRQLEKTNHGTIARLVRDALRVVWPDENNDEKLLLFVTDAAAYMLKAGQSLNVFYPNMIHLTCLAHGIHRVAETIRGQFPRVNKIISSGKKVFLKAPSRIVKFKEMLPDTPLPPQPVITRWGTWLDAALYYAEYSTSIKSVIDQLDDSDATSIHEAKVILSDPGLVGDLAFIKCHLSTISSRITVLETRNLALVEAVKIVKDLECGFKEIPGPIGETIVTKFNGVLQRNPGWKDISDIASVLEVGGPLTKPTFSLEQLVCMKYCPITSCEVERSFSCYKNILSEQRTRFTLENLEKYIISHCNM